MRVIANPRRVNNDSPIVAVKAVTKTLQLSRTLLFHYCSEFRCIKLPVVSFFQPAGIFRPDLWRAWFDSYWFTQTLKPFIEILILYDVPRATDTVVSEYLKEQDKLRKQAEAVTKDRATALTPKTTPSEQATTVENVQSANTSAEQSTLAPVNTNQPKAN